MEDDNANNQMVTPVTVVMAADMYGMLTVCARLTCESRGACGIKIKIPFTEQGERDRGQGAC